MERELGGIVRSCLKKIGNLTNLIRQSLIDITREVFSLKIPKRRLQRYMSILLRDTLQKT